MKFKKMLSLIAGTLITINLTGCAIFKSDTTVSLFDKGLALINKVDALAENKDFISLFSTNEEISNVINDIASKEYTKPKTVFALTDLDNAFVKSVSDDVTFPENIKDMLKGRFSNAIPSQVNAINGTTSIAATGIIAHSDSFVYGGLNSPTTYLYIFDNGYNFMVTFVPSDENIINATANIVINSELAQCTTADMVKDFLRNSLNLENVPVSVVTEEK